MYSFYSVDNCNSVLPVLRGHLYVASLYLSNNAVKFEPVYKGHIFRFGSVSFIYRFYWILKFLLVTRIYKCIGISYWRRIIIKCLV